MKAEVEEQAEGKTRLVDLDVHCTAQGTETTLCTIAGAKKFMTRLLEHHRTVTSTVEANQSFGGMMLSGTRGIGMAAEGVIYGERE